MTEWNTTKLSFRRMKYRQLSGFAALQMRQDGPGRATARVAPTRSLRPIPFVVHPLPVLARSAATKQSGRMDDPGLLRRKDEGVGRPVLPHL